MKVFFFGVNFVVSAVVLSFLIGFPFLFISTISLLLFEYDVIN
ncbi:hypothetical protein L1275_000829 [Flavobacterium sp. HSC-61S13]|nr:hypothetical protein [Flavobacterium sp. HSC-61S13]